jgi:hypothetical protein
MPKESKIKVIHELSLKNQNVKYVMFVYHTNG